MMEAVADSSSPIVLARQDALWLLERIFQRVVIVLEVEDETAVQGKARGYADAERIDRAIQTGKLVVVTPTTPEKRLGASIIRRAPTLSRTDCLTLACAKERGLTLVMEEQRGRNVAVSQGISYMTIQVLPLHGFISQKLSFEECTDLLDRIGRAMHTDEAILTVLRAAAKEIQRLRSTRGEKVE
jgi:predicted nucleic acid-binding protein